MSVMWFTEGQLEVTWITRERASAGLTSCAMVAALLIYYVTASGNDLTGTGSLGAPWATIQHAVANVKDGSTVLVGPGTYSGRVRLDRAFASGIVVRSQVSY